MDDFVRCNKLTGVYWLQGPVDKLKIKIKLKPPDDVISLPTFEDFTNETTNISLEQNIQEYSFNWQEKSFSECEVQRYKDVHNCLTETELGYHELIKSKQITSGKVFTHIHEDHYTPPPQLTRKSVSLLSSCLERLSLDGGLRRMGEAIGGKSTSERHLFRSQEDISEEEPWTAMHVLLDNSDCNEERVAVRQGATLVSVFHNTARNYVLLQPDVNELETNPYVVETDTDRTGEHHYGVALDLGAEGSSEDLESLVVKLYRRWQQKHGQVVPPPAPAQAQPGGARLHVALEIVSAAGFDAGNLYIEYHIKLPEGARCEESLRGRSHVSEPRTEDGARVYHFGHLVELCLDIHSGKESAPLTIYLEVISRDWWRRHRSCGYAHLSLPLSAGHHARALRCVRPDERGADERSFFLGGCRLIEDLEVLSRPDVQNGDYTHTETGCILVRAGTLLESRGLRADGGAQHTGGAAPTSELLVGAEAALRKYRRARARLARASSGDAALPASWDASLPASWDADET